MSLPPTCFFNVDPDDLESVVLPRLLGTVFHMTSERNLYGIIYDRQIRTSRKAGLETSWPGHSEESYAYKQDCVSLFDFRGVDMGSLRDVLCEKQDFLNPSYACRNVAFLVLAKAAHPEVIHSRDVPNTASFVPRVEAFYPGDLPLDLIDRILRVTVTLVRYDDSPGLALIEAIQGPNKEKETEAKERARWDALAGGESSREGRNPTG